MAGDRTSNDTRAEQAALSAAERVISRALKKRRDLLIEARDWRRLPSLADALRIRGRHGHAAVRYLVVTTDRSRITALDQQIRAHTGQRVAVLSLDPGEDAQSQVSRISGSIDVVVSTPTRLIDHLRRGNLDVSSVCSCVIDAVVADGTGHFGADLQFVYAKIDQSPTTTAFVQDLGQEYLLGGVLRRPLSLSEDDLQAPTARSNSSAHTKEQQMSDLPFDPSELREKIAEIVQEVHEEADPGEMMAYRKYARKYTTLFNRGYVFGYLMKQAVEGGSTRPRSRKPQRSDEPSPDHQSVFVSVGRNRRIHARDLITFFTSADGVTRDDIGQIKVLDNYSFVEVATGKAQAAIDELNGKELRGRKLTVNFARKK